MTWLPKGERPSTRGWHWVEWSSGEYEPCEISEHGKTVLAWPVSWREGAQLGEEIFNESRFSLIALPREWDLVRTLQEHVNSTEDYATRATLEVAIGFARAYLAGEPKP